MTHLLATEFHLHRTSCLTGDEFPCHVANVPEPFDPIWDEQETPAHSERRQSKYTLQSGTDRGPLPARPLVAGKDHVSFNPQEEF